MDDVMIAGARRFDLETAGGTFRIFVWQPQMAAPQGGFPVVYALDGNAHFMSLIASAKANGIYPHLTGLYPAVIVAIGYPVETDHDLERRTFDYTPDVDAARLGTTPDGRPWGRTGGADAFLDMLDRDLRPRIEAAFAIDRERQSLFGHSFGGLCTLYAALTRPASFRNFLASSPSLWFGEKRVLEFLDGFAERLASVDETRSLVLSVGALEQTVPPALEKLWPAYAAWIRRNNMVGNLRDLKSTLDGLSLPLLDLHFHETEGEHHGSVPPVAINRAMRVALKPRGGQGVFDEAHR